MCVDFLYVLYVGLKLIAGRKMWREDVHSIIHHSIIHLALTSLKDSSVSLSCWRDVPHIAIRMRLRVATELQGTILPMITQLLNKALLLHDCILVFRINQHQTKEN